MKWKGSCLRNWWGWGPHDDSTECMDGVYYICCADGSGGPGGPRSPTIRLFPNLDRQQHFSVIIIVTIIILREGTFIHRHFKEISEICYIHIYIYTLSYLQYIHIYTIHTIYLQYIQIYTIIYKYICKVVMWCDNLKAPKIYVKLWFDVTT